MTHQVGRAEAGVREEKPLPVDKARGQPFFCIMVYAFGVLFQKAFHHSCYKDSPTVYLSKVRVLFVRFCFVLFSHLGLTLIHLESPFYEILGRDPVVIFLHKVSAFSQPYE